MMVKRKRNIKSPYLQINILVEGRGNTNKSETSYFNYLNRKSRGTKTVIKTFEKMSKISVEEKATPRDSVKRVAIIDTDINLESHSCMTIKKEVQNYIRENYSVYLSHGDWETWIRLHFKGDVPTYEKTSEWYRQHSDVWNNSETLKEAASESRKQCEKLNIPYGLTNLQDCEEFFHQFDDISNTDFTMVGSLIEEIFK